MTRYSTNAIYEYLKQNEGSFEYNYLYINENNWIIIYGNENTSPKLILIVTSLSDITQEQTEFEKKALSVMLTNNIPIRLLRFEPNSFSQEVSITTNENNEFFTVIETSKLYSNLFEHYGLSAGKLIETKEINVATSSTFHEWQRNFLSGKLNITDIDLIVYDSNNLIIRIYELKRSYIPLLSWKPYSADYANFKLLRRSFLNSIPIFILYNLYTGNPRIEDLSTLTLFKINDDIPTIVKCYKDGTNYTRDYTFLITDLLK